MPTGVLGQQVAMPAAYSSPLASEEIPLRKLVLAPTTGLNTGAVQSLGTLSSSEDVSVPAYTNPVGTIQDSLGTIISGVYDMQAKQGTANSQLSEALAVVAPLSSEISAVGTAVALSNTILTTPQTGSSALTGWVEEGSLINELWEHVTGVGGFDAMDDAIDYMASALSQLNLYGLFRMYPAVNFMFNASSVFQFGWTAWPAQLQLCTESARMAGESDVAMLLRLAPDYPWVSNFEGSDYAGASFQFPSGGGYFNVFYIPPPPTLAQIKALWNYTPSSGPPERNGITDSMDIWAMLPIQY